MICFLVSRGLVASKMTETAAGMVDNFLEIVETHGFIPNGSRTYYENRRLVVVVLCLFQFEVHLGHAAVLNFFFSDMGVLAILCV
jgi:neutral trehalase